MSSTTSSSGPALASPWPAAEAELLARADKLLDVGKPAEALALVSGAGSQWIANARGVCYLRLGQYDRAVDVLRGLVFERSGLAVRSDSEPVFQSNFATALLLSGNSDGFHGILAGIRDRSHPAVVKLTGAVRRWKGGMGPWQRMLSFFGMGGPPLVLDFPPGDLS